jgi:hypothetical protein
MRYSLLLLPLAAWGLAGCVAPEPAQRVTTTYTPATTTTYVTPVGTPYDAPAQSTTTYVTPAPGSYGAPVQSSTTTYTNAPYAPPTQTTTTVRRSY